MNKTERPVAASFRSLVHSNLIRHSSFFIRHSRRLGLLGVAVGLSAGCIGKPDKANIALRKEKQTLEERIAELEKKQQSDAALIVSLQSDRPTVPTLPPDRLAQLYTARGLQFGRLTGGLDTDRKQGGDEALKVYVVPIDQDGQPLKAAGSFQINVFDLANPEHPLIGKWTFDPEASKKNWFGGMLNYTYAFTLPLKRPPEHAELTVKVAFTEALTGLKYESQTVVTVKLPPATQPTSQPTAHSG